MRPRPIVVLSVRAYCSATPPCVRRGGRAHRLPRGRCPASSASRCRGRARRGSRRSRRRGAGVRREHERRELRHRRVEQELRLHRVPVLRVEVGRRRAVDAEAEPAVAGWPRARRRSRSRRAARPRRRPGRRRARRVGTRGSPAHLDGGWLGGAMSRESSRHETVTWWCWGSVRAASTPRASSPRPGSTWSAVDEALVGGECPFWGCTPSKLMVRPADLIAEVRRADRLAGEALVRPDWSLVAARIRKANHDWTDGQHVEPLEHAGVRIVRGHGRLDGPGRGPGRAGRRRRRCCGPPAASCSTPAPSRCGRRSTGSTATPYWTNRETMQVTEVPDRLVVVGGGPNGLELAQVFARYGARVTLLEVADRIAASEEPEASARADDGPARRGDRGARRRRDRAGRPRRRVPRARRRARCSTPTSCWSRPAAAPTSRTSASRPSGWTPRRTPSRSTSTCAPASGCGRSATSPGRARSPTSRATRPPARSRTSSARTGRRRTTARSPGSRSPTRSWPRSG